MLSYTPSPGGEVQVASLLRLGKALSIIAGRGGEGRGEIERGEGEDSD